MLKGMLTIDYKKRFTFKKALAVFITIYGTEIAYQTVPDQ